MTFEGQTIAIIGAAATGRAAAPVLARRGARILVFDAKPLEALGDAVNVLSVPGVELRAGEPACPGIEEADLIVPSPGVSADSPVIAAARRRGVPVVAEIELAGA